MPHISECQKLLNALSRALEELGAQIYVQLLLDAINAKSPTASSTNSTGSLSESHSKSHSTSDSHSETTQSDTNSYSSTTESSSSDDIPVQDLLLNFYELIMAQDNEVRLAQVLRAQHSYSIHNPQLQLLDGWQLDNPKLFCCKLRVSYEVFVKIVDLIQNHHIFHNNSNNPQLPVQIQQAIFLNAARHYGNAATS
ncbi:hypothetical protein J3R82DRAFT_2944 [Butyriboletus roseoflavus]|nr:hypothetical protein J3R82DRAFT_2944 [Butyriboletus roseoflavus]